MEGAIRLIRGHYPVNEMYNYVRMGVFDREELINIWCEQMLDPSDYDENMRYEVTHIIDWLRSELDREKATWPDVTDCELLDRAFERLTSQGIVCIHHVGTTPDVFGKAPLAYYSYMDRSRVVGYCFYTADEMKSAISEAGMYIRFDSRHEEFEPVATVKVGQAVKAAFEAEGFEVRWDGDPNHALFLVNFLWQN